VITPRTTRLLRAPDLHTFRRTVIDLACAGGPFDIRNRLIVVPTQAAAAYLLRSIERQFVEADKGVALPEFVTRADLVPRLAERLPNVLPLLTGADREALLGAASRRAKAEGAEPPFRLRPGLIAEMLRLYDSLQLNLKDINTFERLALGMLEPGASEDRGAERLVRQTRFLATAFRHFERACLDTGSVDEHSLRRRLLAADIERPWRHVIVAVGDCGSDPHGLFPAHWDLLARVPAVEKVDIVATDARIANAFHEKIHQALPGIEEHRVPPDDCRGRPVLLVPPFEDDPLGTRLDAWDRPPDNASGSPGEQFFYRARDREEEVAGFARWVREKVRNAHPSGPLEGFALVVRKPLPYMYVAREVLRSAGVPSQVVGALPLASEPHAAAVDLIFAAVIGNFARTAAIALLRSPLFDLDAGAGSLTPLHIAALDRALGEANYLGDIETLQRVVALLRAGPPSADRLAACRAGDVLLRIAGELHPLRAAAPCGEHLGLILSFLRSHAYTPELDAALDARLSRGRAAVVNAVATLREAYARFDPTPVDFELTAAIVKRSIDGHTFVPHTEAGGVQIVDADSASFGDFDHVQLAGLVEGEWPDGPRRNIFYPPALLRELGWPAEVERLYGLRAGFNDLLRLPAASLVVSTFALEDDAIVVVSPLADLLPASGLHMVEHTPSDARVFDHEALAFDPVETGHLGVIPQAGCRRRIAARSSVVAKASEVRAPVMSAYSVSALERYQDCPFKFFAVDVLGLDEPVEDQPVRGPRARGKFLHELFQRFFETWDARGFGAITVDRVNEARTLFEEVAAPLLARLPEADAMLEHARLFGSAIGVGIVDVVLEVEVSRPALVRERRLEYRLDGEFSLGAPHGRRIRLKGVADRIDLLADDRIRVIDYKSGYAPNPQRALQAAIYALCARELLSDQEGRRWSIDEAAYIAFSGKRAFVPIVRGGAADADEVLARARGRLFDAVDRIERGQFMPKPFDPRICGYCAYPSVCRKDYVGDQ
jgi:RecB family exonuclease/inactivated superfamily I helicase